MPSEAKKELENHTFLVLSVLRARNDEALVDLAARVRQGDENAAKQIEELDERMQALVAYLITHEDEE